jgi:hypothetical protein
MTSRSQPAVAKLFLEFESTVRARAVDDDWIRAPGKWLSGLNGD